VTFYTTTTTTTTITATITTTFHNLEEICVWYVASPDTMEVALWFAGRGRRASEMMDISHFETGIDFSN